MKPFPLFAFTLSALVLCGCSAPDLPVRNHAADIGLPPLPTAYRATVIELEPKPSTLLLSWDVYPVPASFNIYAATSPLGPWQRLTNTSAHALTLPASAPALFFWVTATNAGRESPRPPL